MTSIGNITIYADDPLRLADFWCDVFGYPHARIDGELRDQLLAAGLTDAEIDRRGVAEPADGDGLRMFFHHADGPKTGRNRLHLDLNATPGHQPTNAELDAEKDRIVGLGASVVRLVDQNWGPWPERYWQLRDPEGNEFCLQ